MIDFIGAGCGVRVASCGTRREDGKMGSCEGVKVRGRAEGKTKRRSSKLKAESSKSKDVIDFIRVWCEEKGDLKQRPLGLIKNI